MPIAATGETPVLSIDDSHLFFAEHLRCIKVKLSNLEKSFKNDELVTIVEATVVVCVIIIIFEDLSQLNFIVWFKSSSKSISNLFRWSGFY
jgi:hypothetical protein